MTASVLAAAACTTIPDSEPVMLDVAVSVAVIDCTPGRFECHRETVRPRVGGGERVVGRQHGMRDRCSSVPPCPCSRSPRCRTHRGPSTVIVPAVPAVTLVGNPVTVKLVAAAACTAIPDSLALRLGVTVSVAVIDCVPDVSSVTDKAVLPRVGGGKRVDRAVTRRADRCCVSDTVPL